MFTIIFLDAVPDRAIGLVGRIVNCVSIANGTAAVYADGSFVTKVGHWDFLRRQNDSKKKRFFGNA